MKKIYSTVGIAVLALTGFGAVAQPAAALSCMHPVDQVASTLEGQNNIIVVGEVIKHYNAEDHIFAIDVKVDTVWKGSAVSEVIKFYFEYDEYDWGYWCAGKPYPEGERVLISAGLNESGTYVTGLNLGEDSDMTNKVIAELNALGATPTEPTTQPVIVEPVPVVEPDPVTPVVVPAPVPTPTPVAEPTVSETPTTATTTIATTTDEVEKQPMSLLQRLLDSLQSLFALLKF